MYVSWGLHILFAFTPCTILHRAWPTPTFVHFYAHSPCLPKVEVGGDHFMQVIQTFHEGIDGREHRRCPHWPWSFRHYHCMSWRWIRLSLYYPMKRCTCRHKYFEFIGLLPLHKILILAHLACIWIWIMPPHHLCIRQMAYKLHNELHVCALIQDAHACTAHTHTERMYIFLGNITGRGEPQKPFWSRRAGSSRTWTVVS